MAARFWVGGAGTWDASDTTHWAATTGGAGGQSVPTSADDVTFDGASGGGTVTVNGNHTIKTLSTGEHSGTLDWSVNNNNLTVTGGNVQFSNTGVRTLKLGSGTFQFESLSLFSGASLTWLPGTSLIKVIAPLVNTTSFNIALASAFAVPNLEVGPDASWYLHTFSQSPILTNFNLVGIAKVRGNSITITIGTLTCSGYSKGRGAEFRGEGGTMNLVLTNPATLHWAVLRSVNCTSAAIRAFNSLNGGNNTNCQISPPKSGRIIGG